MSKISSNSVQTPNTQSDDEVGSPATATTPPLRYIYYLVYTENGARPSKQPVKSHDPHLGRIWAKQVTPPHTVASLKRCICEVENIPQSACIRGQLFNTTSSESPLSDGPISILAGDGPGFTPEEPMAFLLIALDLTFSHKVQARCTWDQRTEFYPSRYLSLTENEILYTNGIVREDPVEIFRRKILEHVYQVINSGGQVGFASVGKLLLC